MTCPACQDKPRKEKCGSCGKLPPVLEIKSEECPVLFHTVEVEGNIDDNPPEVGKYRNALVVYKEDNYKVMYSSDGIPSNLGNTEGVTRFDALIGRPLYAGAEMTSETSIPDVAVAVGEEEARAKGAEKDLSDRIDGITVPTKTSELTNDGADGTSTYVESDELATVATTGAYSDLTGTPTIPSKTSDLTNDGSDGTSVYVNADDLATVATSGSYNDLLDQPSIPSKTSDLSNDGSDGTSTYVEADELAAVATSGSYTDLIDTPTIDSALSTSSENAVQNKVVSGALDRSVDTALAVDPTVSTTVLQLKETQTNLMTGTAVTNNIPLPVASSTQAGVMNSSTYDAVTSNTTNINALLNGAVAVTGLPASPTQSQITTAWQTETGLTTLVNRASVYDVTNSKVWTYYTNDTTWHAATNTSQVTVNQFTNSALGTIKGSTVTGQVFAENDGTGSVNGWDTLSGQVSTNTSKLGTIAQGAEVNVQSNWNEADSASDAYILNKPANLVQDANYVHTDNNFTTTLKDKLDGIASGAEVNVQADLDQTDTSSDDFVKGQFVKRYRTTSNSASYSGGYVYLGSMRANASGSNFSSISIEGRVGGWVSTGNAYVINLILANRSQAMAEGSVIGPSGALTNQFDIVAYQDTNATTGERTRWYLKQITSYATADITVRYQQPEDFNDKWVFTKSSTTPTGVQVYSLTSSIQAKNGKVLYYNTEDGSIPTINQLPSGDVGNASRPVYLDDGAITACNQQSSGHNWNVVPWVTAQGVMEVGKYIDFHNTGDGTTDNDGRLTLVSDKTLRMGGDGADIQTQISGGAGTYHSLNEVSENAARVGSVISTTSPNIISTSMIQDGAVTAAKLGSDVHFMKLTMSTTDIGEGATLAADTLYGVYE